MLEATVADPKKISDVKDEALKALIGLQDLRDKANTAVTQKQADWANAKAAAIDAGNSYSTYAGLAAASDAILKDLASVRASADKEGGANNVARMYFLVLLMTDLLKQLNLPAQDDYTAELNSRASALGVASQDEKLAKIAADKAAADAALAQKTLDEARASWRQKMLDSIPDGGAVAGAAVAAPAPAAPAQAPAPPAAPSAQPDAPMVAAQQH
jgi:hypothetical protein